MQGGVTDGKGHIRKNFLCFLNKVLQTWSSSTAVKDMHPRKEKRLKIDENPFSDLKISDYSILNSVNERTLCSRCNKSRKYFCYLCYIPVKQLEGKIPRLKLPIKIDIIKHRNEIDGKSTSCHAALIAPEDVRISTYPCIPEFDRNESVVLIYPGKDSKTVKEYSSEISRNGGQFFTRAVFIDSTWNQSKGIYKDERIRSLPTIVLKNKVSQFWRHQKNSPRWYLATIEAIHQLLVELDCEKVHRNLNDVDDSESYDGKYDDLLFFFCFMYSKIHDLYDHDSLLSYKRPLE